MWSPLGTFTNETTDQIPEFSVRESDVEYLDITDYIEGSTPLHHCRGCTFVIVRKPGVLMGRYKPSLPN